jgi:hypothetical protein
LRGLRIAVRWHTALAGYLLTCMRYIELNPVRAALVPLTLMAL